MHKHKHLSNHINIYQTKIHETHMEEGFSLLLIMKRVQITTQRLRQGLLCNQRILSFTAPKILYKIHQHNFAPQVYVYTTPSPRPIFIWMK